jgi:NAD(P)-dependent dehydrogenase (short-subunit alcohol dehydrogenase family)
VRKEDVDKVVSEFGDSERIYGAGVDVADRDQVAAFVSEALRRFGKLYRLVNSAGIRGVGNVLDTDPEVLPIPRFFGRSCRSTSKASSTCARLSPAP